MTRCSGVSVCLCVGGRRGGRKGGRRLHFPFFLIYLFRCQTSSSPFHISL